IVANAHDLGIQAGEPCQFGMERRHLGGSGGGPVQRMEGQYHVLLAAIVAEAEAVRLLAYHSRQLEIGRHGAHPQCGHETSLELTEGRTIILTSGLEQGQGSETTIPSVDHSGSSLRVSGNAG